jgi:ABC-type branched-subunit amino acid transport system ATPase component/MFS family permease
MGSRSRRGPQAVNKKRPSNGTKGRSADVDLARIEAQREGLRTLARSTVGVVGDQQSPPLRETIRRSGAGWYPLLALGALVIVDEFQGNVLGILGPEIAGALGLSKSSLAGAIALKTLAITLAALPMAAYVQRRARRGSVSVATGVLWSLMTIFTAFVTNGWGLLLVLLLDGASTGSVRAVHGPLLVDSYPPEARMRGLSFYAGANGVGQILGPVLIAVLAGLLGLTWRGVFVGMGIVCFAAAAFALRLRDPGFGRWDSDRLREQVRHREHKMAEEVEAKDVQLGFFEITTRLMLIPTIRRMLVAFAVLGMFLIPLITFLAFFLDEEWGMGPAARAVLFAVMPVVQLAALWYVGRRGEALFREDPARLVDLGARLLGIAAVAFALAILSPWFVGMALMLAIGLGSLAALTPAMTLPIYAIVAPRMRPHLAALANIAVAAVGGFGGLLLLSGIDRRFGTAGAIISLSLPGVLAALVLRSARRTINTDLDQMLGELVEEEEIAAVVSAGRHVPMLACRHINFSYDQLQVLFDVDFTVDDGEMVALLGTNGAGKSTLLRVISGLGLPSSGTVRLKGVEITHLGAERRLPLGIIEIPGGRSVFGPMTVVENLRAMGYSFGRNRRAVESGIEASFEGFPRLGERRDQIASTLSGGEQQMLGLAAALILKPRLLLIDELSLGLAPAVISELLEMVKRINAAGTAVVLVEQSVNIALTLVEHAYFMEKGEIRFDGKASDLLRRPTLLRSVFLEGAKSLTVTKR